jgi:hypothetical protein
MEDLTLYERKHSIIEQAKSARGRAILVKNIVQHRVCACSIPSCIKLMDWRVFSLPNDSRVAHPLT